MSGAIYFLLCLALASSCEAYKALVVYPMAASSHSILGAGVVRQLLKDGHEVTYITAVEYKNSHPNLRLIDVTSNFDLIPPGGINITALMNNEGLTVDDFFMKTMMTTIATKTLEHQNVQKLLNDPKEQFDVVIVEWMITEITSALAALYDCPLIWVVSAEIDSATINLVDQAASPAYLGDIFTGNSPPFTFCQRVEELWTRIKREYHRYMYFNALELQLYNTVIAPLIIKRGRQPPSFYEVRYNASLVLANSHVSMGQAASLPQSYKPIGGYHIEEEVKPLPEDLEKIMMSAKDGVIYFSMGSNLKSKDWPEEIKVGLLKIFGELKQTVIWKFEGDLKNVPKNVHILKWAPQPSILSHPKCVLFVTHGGLLSTTETIHYGVPIIGIPVFGDQFVNVQRAVNRGFGLQVNLSYNTPADLKAAINEILSNPKYRQKVKELSLIYHDRVAKPGAELIHWVNHVVRTRGAPHLRSPALSVPLYQILYLDLAALLAVIGIVILVALKALCSAVCPKNKVDSKKKNK